MTRKILFFSLILFFISNIYSFDILDSQNNLQTHFSLNNNNVLIKSTENSTLTVTYNINHNMYTNTYYFNKCNNIYCINLNLTDIIENNGENPITTTQFNLSIKNTKKQIYLDTEAPKLEILSTKIINDQVYFEYQYSDNLNTIQKIELYTLETNNDLTYINNIIGKTKYNYTLTESKKYTFQFKIFDKAGNYEQINKEINVYDIFPPTIKEYQIINNNNIYQLKFKLSDNNLSKYELIHENQIFTEKITGQNLEKTINIPSDIKSIILKATDTQNNSQNITINLKSPLTISNLQSYSNKNQFEFKSNAENCYLDKIDSDTYNKKFNKLSNKFTYNLDTNISNQYQISYYCNYKNYQQHYTATFYYDNKKPTIPVISTTQLENGNIKISWTESTDNESTVKYTLYKNNTKIYEGSKTTYEDDNAIFPNFYEYYVEASDKAGNAQNSETSIILPKKVTITYSNTLEDNMKTTQNTLQFTLETDKNATVNINVKNNAQIIDALNIANTINPATDLQLLLSEGINQILININDNLGNTLEKTYFITMEPEILAIPENTIEPQPIEEEPLIETVTNDTTYQPNTTQKQYNWIWFIIILIALIYFTWYFIFNEDRLRKKNSKTFFKNTKLKTKPKGFKFKLKQNKDEILAKDFLKIKKQRILKQKEIEKEIIRQKKIQEKENNRTTLQQQKLDDLTSRKPINIPFTINKYSQTQQNKKPKKPAHKEELESSKQPTKPFSSIFRKKPRIIDEMTHYLNKVKQTPSWNSTKDYIYKEPVIEQKPVPQPEKPKEIIPPTPTTQNNQKEELHLDDYLNKIIKRRKKKNLYLAEKLVEKDIKKRE